MAGIKVAVGEEYFEELRKNGCYYVDKTEMIYQIAAGGEARVTLFTRPRRFGKTLTMTMLRSFFDLARESKDVFNGLAVSEHKDFCREWQNQYPVLFISFKDVEGLDYEEAYEMLWPHSGISKQIRRQNLFLTSCGIRLAIMIITKIIITLL